VLVTRTTAALRTSGAIALGAFAVHQLRYLAGYGDDAGAALGAQGHDYLGMLLPLVLLLFFSGVLGTLAAVALGRGQSAPRSSGSLFCALAVLTVFGLQETAEGIFSAGHPGGLAALLGHGGWVSMPIALAVGRLLAVCLAALGSVDARLAGRVRRPAARAAVTVFRVRAAATRPLACRTLAFGLARRPPPALCR
jgi:hypothetical protein